jgi:MoxR-like ATPase
VFVWAFYGANFSTRFRGTDLRDYLDNLVRARRDRHQARQQAEARVVVSSSTVHDVARAVRGARSVWGALTAADAVHATRCAGASQAADEVMLSAAAALRDEPQLQMVLLTGDRELRRNIVEQLLPGRTAPFTSFDVRGRTAGDVWADVHAWLSAPR